MEFISKMDTRNLDRSKPTLNRNPLIRSAAQWEQRIPGWTEGQSCNIGFSKTSPRIERWLSKNNLGETTVQCWVFLGYRNLPGINLFILFPHLEVNAWQVRLLLSYLYLHLHLPPTKGESKPSTSTCYHRYETTQRGEMLGSDGYRWKLML